MGAETIDMLLGSNADDIFTGFGEDDQLYGGPGLDIALFLGARHEYRLGAKSTNHPSSDAFTSAIVVRDQVAGRDGTDTIDGIEVLRFSDYTVDMRLVENGEAWVFASNEPASLHRLLELYVGFFDRIPEAAGLVYWIDRMKQGATLESIAERFHEAGVAFGVYAAGQSDEQYIAAVYDHLLDRGSDHAQAPTAQEIGYWVAMLQEGSHTRASMVLQMLDDVRAFEGDATYGWVASLLAHKATLAQYYAVEQGLGRHSPQEDIAFGRQLADLVTPGGIDQALALIGLGDGPVWTSSRPPLQGTTAGGEHLQGDPYFATWIYSGGGSGDTLRGGAGQDRLYDDGGAATLIGGGGGDKYTVSGGDDTIIETDVFGSDHVTSHGNFELPDHVEGLTLLSGTVGIGNRLDNTISGRDGNDRLEGRAGADNLIGNTGNDTLDGGAGNDTLSGGGGDDLLSGGAGDDLLYTGTGHDTLQGGDGFDTAWFAGKQSLYTFTQVAAQFIVTGPDRVVTLQEVERLQFQNGFVEIDELVALVGVGDALL
jgi:Ca2+-binding RTX toxin-like protein